jgi:hypothetical protein
MKKQECKWSTPWRCTYASPRRSLLLDYRTVSEYSRITSTKSPSLCVTTDASRTKLTALLPQSHICSSWISRRILALPPLRVQKHAYPRTYKFAHSSSFLHQTLRYLCLTLDALWNYTCYTHLNVMSFIPTRIYGFSWIDVLLNTRIFNILLVRKMCSANFYPNWKLKVESASFLLSVMEEVKRPKSEADLYLRLITSSSMCGFNL